MRDGAICSVGWELGTGIRLVVGVSLGPREGRCDVWRLGNSLTEEFDGLVLGCLVGVEVGEMDGPKEARTLGEYVGCSEGAVVGLPEAVNEGIELSARVVCVPLGAQEGSSDGLVLGTTVNGATEGLLLSLLDGFVVGNNDGPDDACAVEAAGHQ